LRFLVDENLPAEVAALLRAPGHDVLEVAASTHRSSADAAIWQLAIDESRILVTRDLDFPLPRAKDRPPGLVIVRGPSAMRIRDIVELLEEALRHVDLASLQDRVTVVEPGRVRQRPYRALP
jgi:predicted nuclease of predicted toxin-antitoxin system